MSKIDAFEDLEIWKEGMRLCVQIYNLLKDFKDFGLKDQIQRASVSIPSNIAEGYERQTDKELIHFLYIAKGSCAEVRTQLYLLKSLDSFEKQVVDNLIDKTKKISAMISNFIKARKTGTLRIGNKGTRETVTR